MLPSGASVWEGREEVKGQEEETPPGSPETQPSVRHSPKPLLPRPWLLISATERSSSSCGLPSSACMFLCSRLALLLRHLASYKTQILWYRYHFCLNFASGKKPFSRLILTQTASQDAQHVSMPCKDFHLFWNLKTMAIASLDSKKWQRNHQVTIFKHPFSGIACLLMRIFKCVKKNTWKFLNAHAFRASWAY